MAIGKLQIRALPQQTLVTGYPSIPADPLINRPAPEINGIVQLTSSNTELLAAYLTIELLQIQTLPTPTNSPFSTATTSKTLTTISGVPTTLWKADATKTNSLTNYQSLIVPCDFQFKIKLPLHLPPSIIIDHKTGHGISYQLKATLCAKPIKPDSNNWFKRSNHPIIPTIIFTTLDLEINRYDTLPAWPIYHNTSKSNHSTSHHAVSMTITNNRLAIGPGDQISSQILIESSNIHPIKLVRFELNLMEQIIYRQPTTGNKTLSLDLSHQSEEIKLSNISNSHAKINHHVFQKDKLSFNMHLALPINHQKLTVSGATLISISYYMSVKAYFESPRKHFLKTNKEIPTQLLIEKIPLIVGDRDFARAQLAVDKIGPVPNLFIRPNNTLSTVDQTHNISSPTQPTSLTQHRAHNWKQAQNKINQNFSRGQQLPPKASLQLLPKSTNTDFPSSQRSHHSLNPSHPTRHHTFSISPTLPLANYSSQQQYAQAGPSRLSLNEVSQSHFSFVKRRPSSPSHHLDSPFLGSSLQLETPTRHGSKEAPNVQQLTRSLSGPSAHLVKYNDAGSEKARLFERAKAEAAMNQARLQKATFFSSLSGHPMAIEAGLVDSIASSSSSAAAASPTAEQEKQIHQTPMIQDNYDHHGPLANLGIHDERFSEVATISSLPQYSNNPDPILQSDHTRPFSSSLPSGSSCAPLSITTTTAGESEHATITGQWESPSF
ncbi:hypothetical protein VP01_312g11 [Puccinia sorghi]|uniref:Arrestin C-terminal-like domain-containing protein n=1 Tax=Puccinia sorghi TaxID=27349 RepID=A0A0L6UZX8_9BASI|nr:hypothetical protein VP01_312g11 [Puccinia sorghi]